MTPPETSPSPRVLLEWLLIEEWRRHSRLLSPIVLLALPAVLLASSVGLALLLREQPTVVDTLARAAIAVATLGGFYLGVQMLRRGSSADGQVGRLTRSPRTLPVRDTRIIVLFVVKSLLYYGVLVIAPVTVGLSFGIPQTPLQLFVASIGMFTLGIATAVTAITLALRSRAAALLIMGGIVAVLSLGLAGLPVAQYTPAAVYQTTALQDVLLGSTTLVAGLVSAMYLFSTTPSATLRRFDEAYRPLTNALGNTPSRRIAAKIVLQTHRSTGGISKLTVTGVILVVSLLSVLPPLPMGRRIVALGLGIGLLGIPTYFWIVSYDNQKDYAVLPIQPTVVQRATGQAYGIIALPVVTALVITTAFFLRLPPSMAGLLLLITIAGTLLIGWLAVTAIQNSPSHVLRKKSRAATVVLVLCLYVGLIVGSLALPVINITLVALLAAAITLSSSYGLTHPINL